MDIGGISQTNPTSRPAAASQTTSPAAAGDGKADAFGPAFTTALSDKALTINLSDPSVVSVTPESRRLQAEMDKIPIFRDWASAQSDYMSKRNDLVKSVLGLGDNDVIVTDAAGSAALDRLAAAHGLTAPAFPDTLKGTRFDNEPSNPDSQAKTTGMFGVVRGEPGKGINGTLMSSGTHFELRYDRRAAGEAGDNRLALIDDKASGKDDDPRYAITTASGKIAATVNSGGIDLSRDSTILDIFKKLKPYLA